MRTSTSKTENKDNQTKDGVAQNQEIEDEIFVSAVDQVPPLISTMVDQIGIKNGDVTNEAGIMVKNIGIASTVISAFDEFGSISKTFGGLNEDSLKNRDDIFRNKIGFTSDLAWKSIGIAIDQPLKVAFEGPISRINKTLQNETVASFIPVAENEWNITSVIDPLPLIDYSESLSQNGAITANRSFAGFMDSFKDYSYEKIEEEEPALFLRINNDRVPVDELKRAFGLNDLLDISENDMVDFVGRLQRQPMLALEHRVGKRIFNSIMEMSEVTELTGVLHRCRIRMPDEMPWSEFDMWEAPTGISSQGRFNAEGRGFLYLSDNQDVAVAEMKQNSETTYDLMKLDCNAKIRIIDLTKYRELNLFRYCMFEAKKNKREYLVPNFLAQCCELKGIKAIKYRSVYKEDSSNYVFFDYLRDWFKYSSSSSATK